MSEQTDQSWLTVDEVALQLGLSSRAAHRYGELGRIKTKKVGRRTMFLATDVAELASELGAANRPPPTPPPPKQELVPAGQLLDYLRDRDHQLVQAQNQIAKLLAELASERSISAQRLLPEEERQLRNELESLTRERDQLATSIKETSMRLRVFQLVSIGGFIVVVLLAIALILVLLG